MQGRIVISKVHARGKELEEDIDFHKVARATAGSTGAELMNLMNRSAIIILRQGRDTITEADIFEVMTCSSCCQSCLCKFYVSLNACVIKSHAHLGK